MTEAKPEKSVIPDELTKLCNQWPCPDSLNPLPQKMLEKILVEYPYQENPCIIHLCGIPGSGKSTYARKLHQANTEYFVLSFDQIMSQIPDYKEDCENLGLEKALANWEVPARGIGYFLLECLLRSQRSVIFDHSASNESHVLLLEQIGTGGATTGVYQTELLYIPCSLETANARVKQRQVEIQRHTPEFYLTERAKLIEQLLPKYRQVVHRYMEVVSE